MFYEVCRFQRQSTQERILVLRTFQCDRNRCILRTVQCYGRNRILYPVTSLLVLLPGLAVCIRRLHDIGKRWTFILLGLIPIAGAIILIVNCAKDSQPGTNQFGPNPKEV